jgi:hypothetical protein
MLAQWPPSYPIAAPTPVDTISIAGLDTYRIAWTAALNSSTSGDSQSSSWAW